MQTYKIPYNSHKYADASDSPQRRILRMKAASRHCLEVLLVEWRERHHQSGITGRTGNRTYPGMIHWGEIALG